MIRSLSALVLILAVLATAAGGLAFSNPAGAGGYRPEPQKTPPYEDLFATPESVNGILFRGARPDELFRGAHSGPHFKTPVAF